MAFGLRRDVLRPSDSARADRVTYVELFFDLVFVFALTQLSSYLAEHQNPAGLLEGVIMVCALWWAWVSTTWVTNWLDPVALPVRGVVIGLAFVALVMSVAIAEAFGDRAWAFALSYVVLQLGRTGFLVWALWRHDRPVARDFACVLAWTGLASAFWVVGALLPLPAQLPFWGAALAVELAGTLLGYPVPGLGRLRLGGWDVSGPHIAERSALFVLIAIGEGILVAGFAFVDLESSVASTTAMANAFVMAAALWWIYFDHGERVGAETIERAPEPARLARTAYTFVHLLVIAGVVVTSGADKELLGHPDERGLAAFTVVLGGPALFLAGTALFRRVVAGRWPIAHLCGVLAFAALAVVAGAVADATPLAIGLGATLVLVAVAAAETVDRLRRGRRSGG